jgi:hypothetical protein
MKLCDVEVGREGSEWFVTVSYPTGKVTEFRHSAFEEVLLMVTKELDEME